MGNQAALCRPAMDFFSPPESRADYQPVPVGALSMLTAKDRQQQSEEVRQRARAVLDEDTRELQLKKLKKATDARRETLANVDQQLHAMRSKLKLTPTNQILRSQMKGLIQKRSTLTACIANQEAMYTKIELLHHQADSCRLLSESQSVVQSATAYLQSVNSNLSVDDIIQTYDDMHQALEQQAELQLAASRPLTTNSKDQLTADQMEEELNRFLAEDDDIDTMLAAGCEEPVIEMPSFKPTPTLSTRSTPQSVSMTRRLRTEDPIAL